MQIRNMRESGIGVAGEIFGILTRPARAWILAVFPLLFCLMVSGWLSEEKIFILLTLFVVGFGAMGVVWFYDVHGNGFLLNPLVLSSLLTFVVGFGVSNYVLLTDVDQVDYYLGTDAYQYLNKTMILASFAMVSLMGRVQEWSRTLVGEKMASIRYRKEISSKRIPTRIIGS